MYCKNCGCQLPDADSVCPRCAELAHETLGTEVSCTTDEILSHEPKGEIGRWHGLRTCGLFLLSALITFSASILLCIYSLWWLLILAGGLLEVVQNWYYDELLKRRIQHESLIYVSAMVIGVSSFPLLFGRVAFLMPVFVIASCMKASNAIQKNKGEKIPSMVGEWLFRLLICYLIIFGLYILWKWVF